MRIVLCLLISLVGCVKTVVYDQAEVALSNQKVAEGILHLRSGQFDLAEAAFGLAYDLGAKAQALDGLGSIAFRKKDYTRAEELYQQAMLEDSTYTHVYGNIALLYEVQGRTEEAEEMYKKAVELNPTNVDFRNNYAGLVFGNGDSITKRAASRLELLKAAALDTNNKTVEQNLDIVNEY